MAVFRHHCEMHKTPSGHLSDTFELMTPLFGGIDAGGTAFKCIIAFGPERILAEHKVPVTDPETTLAECAKFFKANHLEPLRALGVASFGPIERNRGAGNYGFITTTPKPGWANTDLAGYFERALSLPVAFDTDVNGAVLAETRWGAATGASNAVYVTLGTGIGVGALCNGRLVHGAMHPEAGHMRVPRHPQDTFAGVCPFHQDCAEGLVSGPALAKRLGRDPALATADHPIWTLASHYIAHLCANLALCYAPQTLVLGGGVMQQSALLAAIRQRMQAVLGGYLADFNPERAVVAAGLGQRAGALGAIALAQMTEAD